MIDQKTIENAIKGSYASGHQGAIERAAKSFGREAKEESVKAEIARLVEGQTDREKRATLKRLRRDWRRDIVEHEVHHANAEKKLSRLLGLRNAYTEVDIWATGLDFVLEKPTASATHHLRQQMIDGVALVYHQGRENAEGSFDDYEGEIFEEAQIFVVEHDWAAAFAKAGDYSGGEFHLPFEVCIFEFKVSGRRVIVIATELDGTIYYEVAAKSADVWFLNGSAASLGELLEDSKENQEGDPIGWIALLKFLGPQIKAICVALEAEVAETQVVRAPHKLNRAREKLGRTLLSDYHVVSLTRKARAPRLSHSDPERGKVRLHFRRGHWRHFEAHKTWIKWMLVGNFELGFIDKEYRL